MLVLLVETEGHVGGRDRRHRKNEDCAIRGGFEDTYGTKQQSAEHMSVNQRKELAKTSKSIKNDAISLGNSADKTPSSSVIQ